MHDFVLDVQKLLEEDIFSSSYKKQFSKYKTRCFEGIWVKPAFHHYACGEYAQKEYSRMIEEMLFMSQDAGVQIMGLECVIRKDATKKMRINREFKLSNDMIQKYDLLHLKDSCDQNVYDCQIVPVEDAVSAMIHEDKFIQHEKNFDSFMRSNITVNFDRCMHVECYGSEAQIYFHKSRENEKIIFLETKIPYHTIMQIAFGLQIKFQK